MEFAPSKIDYNRNSTLDLAIKNKLSNHYLIISLKIFGVSDYIFLGPPPIF